jgi:hypothetical protein
MRTVAAYSVNSIIMLLLAYMFSFSRIYAYYTSIRIFYLHVWIYAYIYAYFIITSYTHVIHDKTNTYKAQLEKLQLNRFGFIQDLEFVVQVKAVLVRRTSATRSHEDHTRAPGPSPAVWKTNWHLYSGYHLLICAKLRWLALDDDESMQCRYVHFDRIKSCVIRLTLALVARLSELRTRTVRSRYRPIRDWCLKIFPCRR